MTTVKTAIQMQLIRWLPVTLAPMTVHFTVLKCDSCGCIVKTYCCKQKFPTSVRCLLTKFHIALTEESDTIECVCVCKNASSYTLLVEYTSCPVEWDFTSFTIVLSAIVPQEMIYGHCINGIVRQPDVLRILLQQLLYFLHNQL